MYFNSLFAILATALVVANAASVHHLDAREKRGGPLPPGQSDLDNAPPRKDQTEGVKCDIAQFQKTKGLSGTARDQVDGPYGYLVSIEGNVDQPPGPSKCTRVSCAWDLAVHFCNDNKHSVKVPWKTVAKYVNDIGMTCGGGVHLPSSKGRDDHGTDYFDFTKTKNTNGQKFNKDNWNVYVSGDKC